MTRWWWRSGGPISGRLVPTRTILTFDGRFHPLKLQKYPDSILVRHHCNLRNVWFVIVPSINKSTSHFGILCPYFKYDTFHNFAVFLAFLFRLALQVFVHLPTAHHVLWDKQGHQAYQHRTKGNSEGSECTKMSYKTAFKNTHIPSAGPLWSGSWGSLWAGWRRTSWRSPLVGCKQSQKVMLLLEGGGVVLNRICLGCWWPGLRNAEPNNTFYRGELD